LHGGLKQTTALKTRKKTLTKGRQQMQKHQQCPVVV